MRRCKVNPEVYSALLTAAARSATSEDGDGDKQHKYQHNQLECSEHTLGKGSHKLFKGSFFKFFETKEEVFLSCVLKDFKVNVSMNEKMSSTTGN
mgnify:CR=1 FL=1